MSTISSKEQLKQLFKLAVPVSLGQAGNIIANMTDSAMLGKYDSDHMVASVLGFQVFIILFIIQIGVSIGLTTIIAQKEGEGNESNLFYSGLVANLIAGLLFATVTFLSIFLLPYINPEESVVELAQIYLAQMAISMIPMSVLLTFKQYFEGFSLTLWVTIATIIGNLINILFNYWFIFGHAGFPAMGIEGAGWATILSKFVSIAAFLIIIRFLPKYKSRLFKERRIWKWEECKQIFKVGLPIGGQMFVEVTAFCIAGLMIGFIGKEALGAHNVALQYAGLTFLLVTGISSASTILAGNYFGERNFLMMSRLIKNSLLIVVVYEICTSLIFIIFADELPKLFFKENDMEMLLISITLIKFAALFQIPDGIQNMIQGILRGVQDVKVPMFIVSIVHYTFTLFLGWLLAFPLKMGVVGFWIGFVAGLSILALLLYIRLNHIIKKMKVTFE